MITGITIAIVIAAVPASAPEPDPVPAFEDWAVEEGTPVEWPACHSTEATTICFGLAGGVDAGYTATVMAIDHGEGFEMYTLVEPAGDVSTEEGDAEFVLTFSITALTGMENASEYAGLAGEALTNLNVAEGTLWAELAAEEFANLHEIALQTPGADSAAGQATITAMDSCATAWRASADALEAFDIPAIEAATELIGTCTEDLDAATELLDS